MFTSETAVMETEKTKGQEMRWSLSNDEPEMKKYIFLEREAVTSHLLRDEVILHRLT